METEFFVEKTKTYDIVGVFFQGVLIFPKVRR